MQGKIGAKEGEEITRDELELAIRILFKSTEWMVKADMPEKTKSLAYKIFACWDYKVSAAPHTTREERERERIRTAAHVIKYVLIVCFCSCLLLLLRSLCWHFCYLLWNSSVVQRIELS